MRISDWSSDVCSSDLVRGARRADGGGRAAISARAPADRLGDTGHGVPRRGGGDRRGDGDTVAARLVGGLEARGAASPGCAGSGHSRIGPLYGGRRSEEHTSELQSLMRISYTAFCLKKKKH